MDARPILPVNEGEALWASAVAAGRRALATELLALADRMLHMTLKYAGQRVQFGRPIGSYQAVRHRLAELFVATESARLSLEHSWETRNPFAAAQAKCSAGHAHALATQSCLQVHGAIGFTAEHELHRYSNRGTIMDVLLGTSPQIDEATGEHLSMCQEVPRLGDFAPARSSGATELATGIG